MRKSLVSFLLCTLVLMPFSVMAATTDVEVPTLITPGGQITAVPSPTGTVQPTAVPNTDLSLRQQLTYVRSNMDIQSQWFLYISNYLQQVADYILQVEPEKTDVSRLIATYGAALKKLSDDMNARQQVIPIESAIILSGFGLHILAESMVYASTALSEVKGTGPYFFPSMSLIGESLQRVGDNVMAIGGLAAVNNGNIDVTEYQKQMEAAVFLYTSLQSLFINRERAVQVKANLRSNQASKATNSTFQVINFDASGSQDAVGTIPNPSGYFWDFGDGLFAVGPFVSHTYTRAGTYLVKLMVQGPSGFSAATAEVKIVPVYPVSVIVTDQDSVLGPVPEEILLTANQPITLSGAASYDPSAQGKLKLTWDFGDGKQDTGQDNEVVTHAYGVPGDYELVLRAENGQLAGVAKKKIKVLSAPPDVKLQIRSATQTTWSNPDKTFFTQNIFAPTAFDFTAEDSVGALVPGFNARTQLVQAEWDFGDGTVSVIQDQNQLSAKEKVTHTYENPGTYTVTLRITDEAQNFGQVTKTMILNDSNTPTADFDFQADEMLTTASKVRFDATASSSPQGSVSKYDWRVTSAANEVVKVSNEKIFTYSFPKPGRYEVSLQVTTSLGTVSGRVSHRFFVESSPPLAAFDFSYDPYVPNKITFDATASSDPDTNDVLSFSWDFDGDNIFDLSSSRDPEVTRTLDKVGNNLVTLRVTDVAGLTSDVSRMVPVTSLLVSTMQIQEGSQAIGVAPLQVNLVGGGFRSLTTRVDTNTITSFEWDFGDGSEIVRSTSISQGVEVQSHTYTEPGRYLATLKVADREGEEAVSAYPIHVGDGSGPIASVFFTPSYPLTGSLATLFNFDGSKSINTEGSTTDLDFSWDFGDGSPLASGATTTHQYKRQGTFTVTLTVTDTRAAKLNRVQVQAVVEDLPPTARFVMSPTSGKAPLTVQFDASSSNDPDGQISEYRFDFGDDQTVVSKQPKVAHIYKQPGTYKVELKVKGSQDVQVDSEPQTITVSP